MSSLAAASIVNILRIYPKQSMKKISTSLVSQTKKIYVAGGVYILPKTSVQKYPLLFESLICRIENLQSEYNRNFEIKVFNLQNEKMKAQQDLKDLGGVYVLWCKLNGMFYVGSALRYFTNKGRLTDYFIPSRVKASINRISSKVSPDLAKAIYEYGIESFTLLILETKNSREIQKKHLFALEQF